MKELIRKAHLLPLLALLAGLWMAGCSNVVGGTGNPSVQLPSESRAVTGSFVKGINFNGNAVTVDGNAWTSYASALTGGFSAASVSTFTSSLTWSPTADAATSSVLNTVIYKAGASLSLSQTITNGNYDVYFWVTENYAANARSEDIKLEGVTVATGVGKLPLSGWAKLGPYNVTVADGSLTMDFVRVSGDPQVAGLAIFNGSGGTTPPTTTPGNLVTNPDFESGNTTGWTVNGAGTLAASTAQKHTGSSSALSAGRTATWNGALQNLTSKATNGATLTASAWVRLDNAASSSVQLTIKKTDGSGTSYSNLSTQTVSNTAWTQLSGTYNIAVSGTLSELSLYVEGPAAGVNYYLDDVSVTSAGGTTNPPPTTGTRLRVVVSTDFPTLPGTNSDPDDVQSMVRFLLYSNEFDVEAFISSAATSANIADKTHIYDALNLYDQVDEKLRTHDSRYPTAAALKAITYQGRNGTWGGTVANNIGSGKDSEASNAIISILDKPDTRPVYFSFWGDCSNLAQAVWKVQNTRTAAQLQAFISKIRVYQIAHQDDTIDWLMTNFPTMRIIYSLGTWQGMFGGPNDPLGSQTWINNNVRNRGPLGAVYPLSAIGVTGVKEGDSPSFMILVSAAKGLNDPEDPTQESWGGQFKKNGSTNQYIDSVGGSSISKWKSQYQADFALRAGWMVQ